MDIPKYCSLSLAYGRFNEILENSFDLLSFLKYNIKMA